MISEGGYSFKINCNRRFHCFSVRAIWDTLSTLELYTDVLASKGYGAIFGKHWVLWPFSYSIWHCLFKSNFTRAFFISLALHIWGPTMANSCVLFFTDNGALVGIIKKRTSKTLTGHDSYYVTQYSAAKYGGEGGYIILFRASHVPGLKNSRASPFYRWTGSRNSRRRRTNFQKSGWKVSDVRELIPRSFLLACFLFCFVCLFVFYFHCPFFPFYQLQNLVFQSYSLSQRYQNVSYTVIFRGLL